MKSFRHQICWHRQATSRPRTLNDPIHPLRYADFIKSAQALQQRPRNYASYRARVSGDHRAIMACQVSPRGVTLERGLLPSHPHRLNLQHTVKIRASSTTPAFTPTCPTIHSVFEGKTGTWQYIVADPSSLVAVIIDPVLDYDRATQVITTKVADGLLSIIERKGYNISMILETHAHADHITAAFYLQRRLAQKQKHKAVIGIGKRISQVQQIFGERYGIPAEEYEGVFDKLFDDDELFNIGKMSATAIHLPGHTLDHIGYKIGDNVFCGDSLFHPDIGTARCDFPGGSAKDLFKSGRKLLSMPSNFKIWPGHDYPPNERGTTSQAWMTVHQHRQQNRHLMDGINEKEFVALREKRDATLAAPKLIHQSLQVNIRAGHLPSPNESGHRLLHLPLKLDDVKL